MRHWIVVLVVLVVVVVVVIGTQPVGLQASQQLGRLPTHALLPLGAVQCVPLLLTEQDVLPLLLVRQHVTKPGFPQADLAAHFFTRPRQLLFASTASACCAAQLT